jgi:hypothetical protein
VVCSYSVVEPLGVSDLVAVYEASDSNFTTKLETPNLPQSIFASNLIRDAIVTLKARVDASRVLGIENFNEVSATFRIENASSFTKIAPFVMELPFELWRLGLTSKGAGLRDAHLGSYAVHTTGEPDGPSIPVIATLPEVPLDGETTAFLAADPGAVLEGGGGFVLPSGGAAMNQFRIEGPGRYDVTPDGLVHVGSGPSSLPVALNCWARVTAQPELVCRRAASAGLLPTLLEVQLPPSGFTTIVLFDAEKDTITRLDGVTGESLVVPGIDSEIVVGRIPTNTLPAEFGLQLSVRGNGSAVRLGKEGSVVGFESADPFETDRLSAHITIETLDQFPEDAPFALVMPFSLWRVTLEAEAGFFAASLEGYSVSIGAPWGKQSVGDRLALAPALPVVDTTNVKSQTFFIPVNEGQTPFSGNAVVPESVEPIPFVIEGPGTYVAATGGLRPKL